MILSDRDIEHELSDGTLVVEPVIPGAVQPASIDVHLGDDFLVAEPGSTIDVRQEFTGLRPVHVRPGGSFRLEAGTFALATTLETVTLPPHLVGRLEGKSSLARLGLMIHSAGYLDPGFAGEVTLELSMAFDAAIILYPRMKIGQISFQRTTSPARHPYGSGARGSKYQGQSGPTPSRFHLNFG